MIFGIIAASILAILIGMNVHKQDMKLVHKQEKKTQILQREIKQLKNKNSNTKSTFHGDEIANLGGKDLG
jgi:hypothetical protein